MAAVRKALQIITVNKQCLLRSQIAANKSKQGFHKFAALLSKPDVKVSNDEIQISESCVRQLRKIGETKNYLRIFVEGGGCSGFQYMFQMDSEVKEDDVVFEKDGVKVVTDNDSLEFLKGSTIDYHEELIRSAFRVIDNPSAEQGCSCGASFSLKL